MKKTVVLSMVLAAMLVVAGCGKSDSTPAETNANESSAAVESTAAETNAAEESSVAAEETVVTESTATESGSEKSEGVMTYEEYMAAELESEVTIETYVQAKQS